MPTRPATTPCWPCRASSSHSRAYSSAATVLLSESVAVAIASGLGKDVAGDPLLRGVSFKVERGERLALSGRNGSGKTTLLRMLAGETPIDEGELSLEKGARVALHDQRPPRERDLSLREYVLSGCADLIELEQRLGRLEQEMASGSTGQATLDDYAAAQARLEHAGGYDWRRRATAVVRGLGFTDEDLVRPLRTFSGGELTRGALARTLAGDPDLLLLDEPTNHLDVASLEWLEEQLTTADAAIVLVAHDRWFLEAVGTAVLELEAGRSRFFAGPWHAWRKEKAARELALERAVERQQAEIERLERFVTRFRAGTRSRQAQARVKKLAKIDRLERDRRAGGAPGFKFKEATRSGRVALELEGATIAAGRAQAARRGRAVAGARRAREPGRPQRRRQDHADRDAGRPAPTGRRQAATRPQRRARLPVPARRGDRRRGHGARGRSTSDRAVPEQGPRAARTVPLLRRRGGEGGVGPLGRGAQAALAGDARRLRRERPDPRRAHQPPGPREPGGAGGCTARIRRCACCSCPTTGRCSTQSERARSRSRKARLHSYPGGWADYLRVRDERRAAEGPTDPSGRGPAQRPPPRGPGGQARRLEEHEAPHRGARARGRRRGGGAHRASRTSSPTPPAGRRPSARPNRPRGTRRPRQRVEQLYEELVSLEDR